MHSLGIWLITVGEPLPLPGNTARLWRTGILARTLWERGHEVTWWTSTVDHFEKRFFATDSRRVPIEPRYALQFLHGRLYRRNISLARFRNHREIAAEFARLAADAAPPDVIVCSYPTIELSDEAVRYGRARDIPVLLDVRDLWPDEITVRLPRAVQPLAPWILRPLYQGARRALSGATGIVAISQTYLDWARKLGARVPSDQDLFAPMGYEARSITGAVAPHVAEKLRGLGVDPARRIVWFCGTFVGSIDLETPIHAARLLETDPTLQFVFTGSGERDAQWREQARGLPNVVFTGWANVDELKWLAAHAWLGLAAYKPNAMMSLTNKLFEYMAAGLPILSSLPGEAREMLAKHDIGETYLAGDAADLAARLRRLAAEPERVGRLSANARAVFANHYAAETVYARYAGHVERCAHARARKVSAHGH